MKPYPLAPLNHFTVPFSLINSTPFASSKGWDDARAAEARNAAAPAEKTNRRTATERGAEGAPDRGARRGAAVQVEVAALLNDCNARTHLPTSIRRCHSVGLAGQICRRAAHHMQEGGIHARKLRGRWQDYNGESAWLAGQQSVCR